MKFPRSSSSKKVNLCVFMIFSKFSFRTVLYLVPPFFPLMLFSSSLQRKISILTSSCCLYHVLQWIWCVQGKISSKLSLHPEYSIWSCLTRESSSTCSATRIVSKNLNRTSNDIFLAIEPFTLLSGQKAHPFFPPKNLCAANNLHESPQIFCSGHSEEQSWPSIWRISSRERVLAFLSSILLLLLHTGRK